MSGLESILSQKLIIVIAILVSTGLVVWLLVISLNKSASRLVKRSKSNLDDTLLNALKGPLVYFVILMGLWLALQQSDFVIDPDNQILKSTFFILFLALGYLAAVRLITTLTDWYSAEVAVKTETPLDDHFLPFFRRLSVIILFTIALVVLLGHFSINVSALVTTLGIGTLAIALAAQEVLSNMICGLIIMVDRPFRIGDRIALEELNTWGDVKDISLHSTRVLTRDNRLVSIPNALIGKNRVVNFSTPSTQYRVQTHVHVAYGVNIEQARQVMVEAVRAEPWVMKNKPIEALFLEFQDSGLSFRVRCWIEHFMETRRTIDKLNTAIYKALEKDGIEIPFPQRVLHIHNDNVSKEIS